MNIISIIEKKKNCKKLTEEEIFYFVNGYVKDEIKDYQISSLLMAIYINGMDFDETYYLTKAFIESGIRVDFSNVKGTIVDKHSTGGVGDKTTLILTPLLASMGLKVAKVSGRGLGHTGGTIDKLESIPGFKTELSIKDFLKQVNNVGCSVISQSKDLVIADKKIYALRDVTGTVNSLPLIVSSIISKKIALGSDIICLDVKVGNGTFFTTLKEAKKAASMMIKIGEKFGKKVRAIITNMDQPLGRAIGNKIEVIEAIEVLKGKGPNDLKQVCFALTNLIANESNLFSSNINNIINNHIKDGSAYKKFEEMIKYQGGNLKDFKMNYQPQKVESISSGYVKKIHTKMLGELISSLGGGRTSKEDLIDYEVGTYINCKIGDYIKEGSVLFDVFINKKITIDLLNKFRNVVELSGNKIKPQKEIIKII